MKGSYYSTPRTMRDCTWASWGDPIERPEGSERRAQGIALYIVAAIAVAVILITL